MTNSSKIIVSFTGTREGMTPAQKIKVGNVLMSTSIKEAHHGDCLGADFDFHNLLLLHLIPCEIHIHPPIISDLRAYCKGNVTYEPLPYLTRNVNMVRACHLLIATPKDYCEEHRSGTWYTVRQSRKRHKKRLIVWPDGTTSTV